jgi:hypothetical protein
LSLLQFTLASGAMANQTPATGTLGGVSVRMIEANGVELCAESLGDPAD